MHTHCACVFIRMLMCGGSLPIQMIIDCQCKSKHCDILVVNLWLCVRYDPSTGIYGMDFYVVLERPGYRVGRRRRCKSRVGIQHRVTKEDAMKWFQVKYEGVILNKAQATFG